MPVGQGWERGLRVGDAVANVAEPSDWVAGDPRAVEVTRGGVTETVRATPSPEGRGAGRWSLPSVGLLYAALGCLVRWRRPDLKAARSFWLLTLTAGLATVLSPASAGVEAAWALALQFPVLLLGFWGLFNFFADISSGPVDLVKRTKIIAGCAGGLLALAYLSVTTVKPNAYELVRIPAAAYFIALSSLAVITLVTAYLRSSNGDSRAVLRLMTLGVIAGFSPLLVLVFVPIALGNEAAVDAHFAALALVAIPAAFAYGVLRHELLGIRRLMRRGGVYVLLTGGLLALVTLVLWAASKQWPGLLSTEGRRIWVTGAALTLAALAFTQLRPRIQHLVDRLVYRDAYDYKEVVRGLARQARSSAQQSDAMVKILQQVSALMAIEGYLLVGDLDNIPSELLSGGPAAAKLRRAALGHDVAVSERIVVRYLDGEPVLVLQLEGERALWLGPKFDGESFRHDDLELAEPLGTLMGMLLARSQLTAELQGLNRKLIRAEEEERARLAAEIHDGPLQSAAYLSRVGISSEETAEVSRSLAEELRAIATALRPPVLDDLGLRYAIDWLVQSMVRQSDISVDYDAAGFPEDARLPREVELTVYRSVQESLTNVVKHARGTRVVVTLSLDGGCVRAQVQDNGTGFDQQRQRVAITQGCLGLVGMRERISHVGGQLRVDSRPDCGTRVEMTIPLRQPAQPAA